MALNPPKNWTTDPAALRTEDYWTPDNGSAVAFNASGYELTDVKPLMATEPQARLGLLFLFQAGTSPQYYLWYVEMGQVLHITDPTTPQAIANTIGELGVVGLKGEEVDGF